MEKLENEKLDFGNLKMLISHISMIWVQDELGQDELGDGIFKFWGKRDEKTTVQKGWTIGAYRAMLVISVMDPKPNPKKDLDRFEHGKFFYID